MIVSRRVAVGLIVTAVLLPMLLVGLLGTGRLLAALGDEPGAYWIDRIALIAGLLWGLDLICVVLWLALDRLGMDEPPSEEFEP
jgi:hypothetical protein